MSEKESNRTVPKMVRMTPELWEEITACLDKNGIPNFGAFASMAIRAHLDHYKFLRLEQSKVKFREHAKEQIKLMFEMGIPKDEILETVKKLYL